MDVPSYNEEGLHLASMDIRTENSKDIATFFHLFNEILQKAIGKPDYKFNPHYFVCDKGGANHNAIKMVYGDNFTRIVGCQWHFRSDATKKAMRLPADMKDVFTQICEKLCKSTTTASQYNLLKGQLDQLAKNQPILEPWIKWWDARKAHIFAPFRGAGLPGVNLSEIGMQDGSLTIH